MSALNLKHPIAGTLMLAALGLAFGTAVASYDMAKRSEMRAAADEIGNVRRLPLRAAFLSESMTLAEVKSIMGEPTASKASADAESEARVVTFRDQGVATRVSFEDDRLVGISLDLADIDTNALPRAAKLVKPGMSRNGVVMLLGEPAQERRWVKSGLFLTQLMFDAGREEQLSVFLVSGLVTTMRAGTDTPEDLLHVTLPIDPFEPDMRAVASTTDEASAAAWAVAMAEGKPLRMHIGMTPEGTRAIYGDPCRIGLSSFKDLPVQYELYERRDGSGDLRLTFTGGVLTEFAAGRHESRDTGDALASSCMR